MKAKMEDVVLGVDTHLDIHVGAIIGEFGKLLGTRSVSTSSAGYLDLYRWACSFGSVSRAGVEGTGSYGAALCRFLVDKEVTVFEVNRPDRAKWRLQGKTDPTDAESAARSVVAGIANAIPKQQSGACEAMRIVSVARRSAVKARTQVINQLRAILVSGPQEVRDRLWKTRALDCANACARIRSLGDGVLMETLAFTLKSLAKRWTTAENRYRPLLMLSVFNDQ